MLPAKIMLAFQFMWLNWHDMVTEVPVPLVSGITNVPPPDFCSIIQNLRFGVFTLLPEYPLRYCRMTESVGGGNHGDGVDQALIWEETVESPRHGKIKAAGSKTGGGGGTGDPIPTKEVEKNTTLRGSEWGQSQGKEHVCPSLWSSTPPRVRWSGNLLALPLAGGVQFKLQPQVGPLSLRNRGPGTSAGIRRADSGETMTGRAQSPIG